MKRFNTTGVCVPKKHYMVNIDSKLNQIKTLINNEDYFVINRPRQYGKTTTLHLLEQECKTDYIIISTSFEGIGDDIFKSEETFSREILDIFADSIEFCNEEKSEKLRSLNNNLKSIKDVSKAITQFIRSCEKEVILFIDEVDKSSNNQLFLSFLGMLRNKYLNRELGKDYTFKSVILAGVHDIKNLKLKLRDNYDTKLNSPWNIAVDFKVDMSFSPKEIETMIDEYCNINKIKMDTKCIANLLYYYTSGYPFLVSRLCQIIDEDILEQKQEWTKEDITKSVKVILRERNTLFDDLIKNLENNEELREYIFDIIFNGDTKYFNIDNPLIQQGNLYGILKDEEGLVKVSNRIFEQRIYNYFTSKLENKVSKMASYNFKDNFIKDDKSLDMEKILIKFQMFIKEQYSTIDSKFIEREGRLLFLAFIKPIINGVGFDFKEVVISEERRLDIVVTYNSFKYVVELKIWYGEEYHKKGINQLVEYLDAQGLDKGYLLIYNFNKGKEYKTEIINIGDKEIFIVYV